MPDFALTNPGEFQPGQSIRTELVITTQGPGATPYPTDPDNVYYCEILTNISFTETVGTQLLTSTQSGEFVYAYAQAGTNNPIEGAVRIARNLGGYWVI